METLISKNPASGQVLLEENSFEISKLGDVIREARLVQQHFWTHQTFEQRSTYLLRAQRYLLEHMDEIARAISLNNGKPLVESLAAEVVPMIQTVSFVTKKAKKILQPKKVSLGLTLPTKKAYVTYRPFGVLGIISPWNYPLSTPLAEVFLGLMAGNAVILKPSEVTGLVNKQIQTIIDSMRLPEGLVTVIQGRGDLGAALAKSDVDKIIVTGSVATGKKVMAAASEKLTPVTLELGGKDAMIVLEDADIETASSAAVVGGFYNAGQTCCSVERLLVHEKIAPEFLTAFTAKIEKLRIGESSSFQNDLGPVTFDGQKRTYHEQVQDHLSHGEKTLLGEADYDGSSNFMKPLVVETHDERDLWKKETFGPVVAVKTFKSDDEAVQINNDTSFGLTAVIWARDQGRAQRMARRLKVGTVVINDAPFTNAVPVLPWGGVRDSGFGRVHGEEGLKSLCSTQVVTFDVAGQQKQFWWYPYSRVQYDFFKSYAILFNGLSWGERIRALFAVIKNLRNMGPRI